MRRVLLKPKLFIVLSLSVITMILPIYFLTIDLWLAAPNDKTPGSYKELLLTKTPGRKIIIDSGSNSYFGINTLMLARHFGMPAINMADNAGYPIKHKFKYLTKYAQKGDVILLPLEWQQYTHSEMYDNYVSPVLQGKLSYYYDSLSLIERIQFVFSSVRVNLFLDAFSKRHSSPQDSEWALKQLAKYKERLQMNHDHSFGSALREEGNKQPVDNASHGSCDQYVFAKQLSHGFFLGDEFKEAVSILEEASRRGVSVVFTWPVVVDRKGSETCYNNPRVTTHMKAFTTSIRDFIEDHGFRFIGTPEQSHFPSKYYNDTFFHLTEDGSKVRTRRLIQQLESAGVAIDDSDYSPELTQQQLKYLINELQNQYTTEQQ